MVRSILKSLSIVFSENKYKILFGVLFIFMVSINMITLIGIQWILSGSGPNSFGLFSKPPYTTTNEIAIMWVESNYNSLSWVIYFTPELFITIILSAAITSLLFSEIFYLSKETKNKLKIRKSLAPATSIATLIGVTSIASTTLTCPQCGTISATLIAILVATMTGSTLGAASILVQIAFYLLWIGIAFNIIMLYITSTNLLKVAPIFYIDKVNKKE